ncbi:hypothetical protein FD755_011336, partial [Muntiacus reevesi]
MSFKRDQMLVSPFLWARGHVCLFGEHHDTWSQPLCPSPLKGNDGGVVLNPAYYGMPGHTNIMIHEVGHVLGLYHVFKGVSERESCDDPCRETVPSMETGDLCADTAPTPKSKLCQDPEPANDTCGFTHFPGAPFSNYMSYTDDACTDSFTPNQVARMHCYLDLVYQQWGQSQKPTPIPMPPMVIGQTPKSLTIHWLPPISGVVYDRFPGSVCGACTEDGTFRQYVHTASSRRVCDSSGYWTPEEAVGPPDVDQPCEPSLQAWSPELHLYHMNMTVPCPAEGCSLELLFQHPVQADTLTLWVTYLSMDSSPALFDTEILLEHQKSVHLGPLDTFCDVPLTIKLHVDGKVMGVKVYTFDERMEIDAALLTSQPHSPLCSGCRPVRYQVLREPPFASGLPVVVMHPHRKFTDMEVMPGQMYRYQVQAAAGAELGEASPPLSHIHGAPYCGDGKVARNLGEECDDGDLLNGDGCSRACKLEEGFNCVGEPSLCYIYEGDGICEPFERETSIVDCGLYTPRGYLDQWATQAFSSHEDKKKCPVSLVTGAPHSMVCTSYHPDLPEHRPLVGWFPCVPSGNRPQDEGSKQPKGSLQREDEVWLKVRTYELSCQHNPLVINITHHSNVLFHHATSLLLNFSTPLVGISAVALRTSSDISPSAPNSCIIPEHQGKNHQGQSCQPLNCGVPDASLVNYATFSCSEGTNFLKRCSISCVPPAKLQGLSPWLTCLEDGLWSLPEAYCKLECDAPPVIPNANLLQPRCLQGNHDVGSTCRYECKPGYYVLGSTENKLPILCTKEGLWTEEFKLCENLQGECPPPTSELNFVEYKCEQGYGIGAVCSPSCVVPPSDPVILPENVTADTLEHWMEPVRVQ